MPIHHHHAPEPGLPAATPEIWVGLTADFPEDSLASAFDSILNDHERARHLRYRHQRDRQLHLLARVMCRTILSRCQPDILPQQWEFQPGPHGKPEVVGPKFNGSPLHFNLTHTEGVVVLAVSRAGAVGVDVERTDRPIDHQGLANRYFAEVEAEAVKNCPVENRGGLFYRIWTLKEAYVKAVGQGLAHALDSFWFEPLTIEHLNPNLTLRDQTAPPTWSAQVTYLDTNEPWVVSIVANGAQTQPNWPIHRFQPGQVHLAR